MVYIQFTTGDGQLPPPDKPTIVMLHPLYLNSSWLWGQMDDPRLNSIYNIIAFDTRTSGKSMSSPSGMYDTWVQAADLALCFQVCASF
jgi:pimeloyl-ACP methyl ester carboxylesterase